MEIISLLNEWGVPYVLMGLIGWAYVKERAARTALLEKIIADTQAGVRELYTVINNNTNALTQFHQDKEEVLQLSLRKRPQ